MAPGSWSCSCARAPTGTRIGPATSNRSTHPGRGLVELARIVRPGGRLVLFHPSGRAALAARHGRRRRADDLLAPDPLSVLLHGAGWSLERYDDGPDRFLARQPS